jgi:hypothetical protein
MAEAPERPGPLRRFSTRQADKRAALATQSWPVFFRNLGIEVAVVVGIVLVVTLLVLLVRG